MKTRWYVLLMIAVAAVSCKKDEPAEEELRRYEGGVFISNEGNYLSNNASVTWRGADGELAADPYAEVNGSAIGDVMTDLDFYGKRGYAVMNNSQRVVVFDKFTFKYIGSVTGCDYPRQILFRDASHVYLTNGAMAGEVKVINAATRKITTSIPVGKGPEGLEVSGDYLFVCNSGGWDLDSTVSVIDLTTNTVTATLNVGHRPSSIVRDIEGDLWVLCEGNTIYDAEWNVIGHTQARLVRIDGITHTVTWNQPVGFEGDHPSVLAISHTGETLYYINSVVYKVNRAVPSLPGEMFITGDFNSLDVEPATGRLWVTSIPSFTGNSMVTVYESNGAVVESFEAGIGANGVRF